MVVCPRGNHTDIYFTQDKLTATTNMSQICFFATNCVSNFIAIIITAFLFLWAILVCWQKKVVAGKQCNCISQICVHFHSNQIITLQSKEYQPQNIFCRNIFFSHFIHHHVLPSSILVPGSQSHFIIYSITTTIIEQEIFIFIFCTCVCARTSAFSWVGRQRRII